jgi:adenine C2-methylase RlmN of 23S rRNA A2503 and tRNA A37
MVTEKEKTITTLKRRLLLNEHDTAAQPKERNDTEEMKLMIQRNQIMIETVLLRMEQLRIQAFHSVLCFILPFMFFLGFSWDSFCQEIICC